MRFYEILKNTEKNSHKSRKEIIAQLQLLHQDFINLDDITFSRWVNGATTPCIYKQILMADFFKVSIAEFLKEVDRPYISKKVYDLFIKTFNGLDEGYHRVKYYPSISNEADVGLLDVTSKINVEQLCSFYGQIGFYNNLMSGKPDLYFIKSGDVMTIQKSGLVMSHIFVHLQPLELNFSKVLGLNYTNNDIFMNVGYFSCRNYFCMLLGCMLIHIINKKQYVDKMYVAFRGRMFLNFISELGGDVIQAHKENDGNCPVYIAQFDWLRFISNPIIFILMKDCIKFNDVISDGGRVGVDSFYFNFNKS